jgi:probable addiction module antidote protein
MPKRVTGFREDLLVDLADPQEAAHYLNAALEDSEQMALVALRDIAEARQMSRVAEDAGVAREALYRMLRKTGNPTYSSLMGILNALGLRIVFAPLAATNDPVTGPTNRTGAFSVSAKASISGLANASAAILQGTSKANKLNGAVGGVPRKPPMIEQWILPGSAVCGVLPAAVSLNA